MWTPKSDSDRSTRILLVDDNEEDYTRLAKLLSAIPGDPYRLDWAQDYNAGLQGICREEHEVFLVNDSLGAHSGLDLLREAQSRKLSGTIILLTGNSLFEIDLAAMNAGAADFLEKNELDAPRLERSIRYALQKKRLEVELERRVQQRTAELEHANAALQQEIGERQRAQDALLEADRRKDEFLATLAHELRNPLAPIRNSLEIMRMARDNASAVERARTMIERQVQLLVRLLDDLMDVSRITRGKLRLKMEQLELSGVIDAAVEISQPLLQKNSVQLVLKLPDQPIRVDGDRVRLAQIFANLLNNAAKYTQAGGSVSLTASEVGSEAVVRVKDSGIGIPAEMLSAVFDMFAHVDRSLNRSHVGLGIGLAMVAHLVQMHGGTVEAFSDGQGCGAEFVVRLPLRPAPEGKPAVVA